MKIKANGTEKEVVFKEVYTREIDRWRNNCLMDWVIANTNNPEWVNIPLNNIQKANDYLVQAMTNLTEDEINWLSSKEFNEILKKITQLKEGS